MSILDAAALLLTSQHAKELDNKAQLEELQKLQLENAKLRLAQRQAAGPKKSKKSKAIAQSDYVMKGILRSPTLESSQSFLVAARKATNRQESIAAIDAFVGYDNAGNFGAQDTRARMLASNCLRPVSTAGLTREEERAANNSAKGYVAGLPDNTAKALNNLKAQADKVVGTIIEYQKANNEVAAAVERERLAHINVQIVALGG